MHVFQARSSHLLPAALRRFPDTPPASCPENRDLSTGCGPASPGTVSPPFSGHQRGAVRKTHVTGRLAERAGAQGRRSADADPVYSVLCSCTAGAAVGPRVREKGWPCGVWRIAAPPSRSPRRRSGLRSAHKGGEEGGLGVVIGYSLLVGTDAGSDAILRGIGRRQGLSTHISVA